MMMMMMIHNNNNNNNNKGMMNQNNVSGRPWKTIQSKPTTLLRNSGLPSSSSFSWQQRDRQRSSMKVMKLHEKQLREWVNEKKALEQQQRKEKKLKQQENNLKAELVQTVSSRKVKRMSKKQYLANKIQFRPNPNAEPKVYGELVV